MSAHQRIRSSLVKLFGTMLIAILTLSLIAPAGAASGGGGGKGLSEHDRALLDQAVAQSESTVTVLIASKEGKNSSVASAVTAIGGVIAYQNNDISYIRASVPTSSVETLSANADIQALDIDEVLPIEDPQPDGTVPPTPQTPPSASTPNNNPYMPTGDTGASQFVAAHPTWDGRGTTIGILDTGVSLDHPSLLTTSTGERKVLDWV